MVRFDPLIRDDSGEFRTYLTKEGARYPSVTTILSPLTRPFIDEWRRNIGEEEADKVSARAAARGTRIHSYCEKYLAGEKPEVNIIDTLTFKSLKPVLDQITDVSASETQLWSTRLRLAGTVDCVGRYLDKRSIMDFKTASHLKRSDEIPTYFMQCTAYSMMWEERTGERIDDLLIIMASDDSNKALLFHENRVKWVRKLLEARLAFKELEGI